MEVLPSACIASVVLPSACIASVVSINVIGKEHKYGRARIPALATKI